MQDQKRKRSRADEIYDNIRRMIVSLELPPRAALVEKDLCARFGTSRTPVREAILRLADQGLVEIAPQHGTFVAGIDPRAVRQAHFLRETLEMRVIRKLCEMPELDLSGPAEAIEAQRAVSDNNDYAPFLPLDDAFHASLFALADMGEIWGVIHGRKAHLDRIRFLQVAPQQNRLNELVRHHEAILDAIRQHAAVAAEEMLRLHVSGAISFMERRLIEQPALFHPSPDQRLDHIDISQALTAKL